MWYEKIPDYLEDEKVYTHKEMILLMMSEFPDLGESTYNWGLSSLISKGKLIKLGYNAYSLPKEKVIPKYEPDYSEISLKVMGDISSEFPYVNFVVFETRLMNDFLNHLIGRNTVFVQVEKESGGAVFRYLQDRFMNVIYKPSVKEFELYCVKDSIVVIDLISEAPIRRDNPYAITLEKMLVDMHCDRIIQLTYSNAEYPDVVEDAKNNYQLDKRKMLRYARRRNKGKEIESYLEADSHRRAVV